MSYDDDNSNAVAIPYLLPPVIRVLLSMPATITSSSSSIIRYLSRLFIVDKEDNKVEGYYIREEYQQASKVEHHHFFIGNVE
mmetsp:Transcript_22526/g.34163  ORF Transcript_22526/g.34163 Transcript_22526/m.34163 type:complete len:82 (+) Transcript_22526:66-311(+)